MPLAVLGINRVKPCAPQLETEFAWKLDSLETSDARSSGSMPLAIAADRIWAAYGIFEAKASKRARTLALDSQEVDPGSEMLDGLARVSESGRRPLVMYCVGSMALPALS